MVDYPVPHDELSAVNVMLSNIGLSPINSLTGTLTHDIVTAQNILEETSLAVQMKGWEFNREHEYPLSRDSDTGFVALASNILRMDVARTSFISKDLTQRGTRLYDKTNRTFVFTEDDIKADVILSLPYADLPPVAMNYIAIRAARIFQKRMLGSDTMDGLTEEQEFDALVTLKDAESENADHNIFNHPDVGDIVARRIR